MSHMQDRNPFLLLVLLIASSGAWLTGEYCQTAISTAWAADRPITAESSPPGGESRALNPHSDLIFRATGATSYQDCHRLGNSGTLGPQPLDNNLVRNLREKAKGIHGPGRFADCLRCHAGGSKGVEKY